jgi:phospholipid/cholesterol/gamma-HCH transport system permease protein
MEASTVRSPRIRGPVAPKPSAGSRLAEGFARPVRSALTEAGDMGRFAAQTFGELRGVWHFTSETLRQVGILITGSAAIIVFMVFMMGVVCGTEANYVLRGYGATAYSGVFTSYCSIREMIPYMFGYIFAAKVGCGLCAEIGSMRIQEELDAMESIGLNPMRYVVATRLLAIWLFLPAVFILATGAQFVANYGVLAIQIREVSQGAWENVNWIFTTPVDVLYSFSKVMITCTVIAIIGMYYGYRARGGPVGVGTATAKSMILSLVLLHVINGGLTVLFWGLKPNAPVGG